MVLEVAEEMVEGAAVAAVAHAEACATAVVGLEEHLHRAVEFGDREPRRDLTLLPQVQFDEGGGVQDGRHRAAPLCSAAMRPWPRPASSCQRMTSSSSGVD